MLLSEFRVLTFDCYGTLIDWERGLLAALQPLLGRTGSSGETALEAFARHETAQQTETPAMLYSDVLAQVHHRLAGEWGVHSSRAEDERFGASVPDWPAFPDTPAALHYLKQHYKLVILSNIDRASFAASNRRLGVSFDAVCTAQDIGSYKPDPENFRFLLERLAAIGYGRADILHTAQSLFHDHAPAKRCGLATAWIDRRHDRPGWGATAAPPEGAAWDFRFSALADMVEAHRREAGSDGGAAV